MRCLRAVLLTMYTNVREMISDRQRTHTHNDNNNNIDTNLKKKKKKERNQTERIIQSRTFKKK